MSDEPIRTAEDEEPVVHSEFDETASVLTLTLNRPARLNAVSLPLYEALVAAVRGAERDDRVRAVILTGAGRGFCVGADLKAHAGEEPSRAERRRYIRMAQRANRLVQRIGKPVVAAVNGHAVGAGMELALSCDLVVVAEEAKLRLPEVALGTFVGGGVTYTLPRRAGSALASELLLLADFFSPQDALRMGLINRVVPADQVMETARDLAARLARRAPISLRHAKRLLHASHRLTRAEAMRREADALRACMKTEDWREGIEAFHERREPEYRGR